MDLRHSEYFAPQENASKINLYHKWRYWPSKSTMVLLGTVLGMWLHCVSTDCHLTNKMRSGQHLINPLAQLLSVCLLFLCKGRHLGELIHNLHVSNRHGVLRIYTFHPPFAQAFITLYLTEVGDPYSWNVGSIIQLSILLWIIYFMSQEDDIVLILIIMLWPWYLLRKFIFLLFWYHECQSEMTWLSTESFIAVVFP